MRIWNASRDATTWGTGQRVFADNYHPNADKWTTARTITLAGDATGSVSIDGSIDKTLTVAVQEADNADKLDNQDGSYYRNASNLNAGTISDERLPGSISSDITGNAASADKIVATDDRASSKYPNDFQDKSITGFFTIQDKPSGIGDWYSGVTVKGWSDDYQTWQLLSGSSTGTDNELYFRRGRTNSWESTQRVFMDDYHPNADKWTTARTITLAGDATGSVIIDGSSNETLSISVQEADNADTLDNQDGNYYRNASNINAGTLNDARLPDTISSDITGTAANADKLDNINSTQFLRSDVGDRKTSGNLIFNDSIKLNFGSSSEVEYFFNGSNYYTDINNGANWYIRDGNSGNENKFIFYTDEGDFTATGVATATNFITDGSTPGQGGGGDADQSWVTSNFLGINDTSVNSNLLDNLDSTQFLRSDDDDTMSGKLTVSGIELGSSDLVFSAADTGDIIFNNESGVQAGRFWSSTGQLNWSSTESTNVTVAGSMYLKSAGLYVANSKVWTVGTLTNVSQLSNNSGYLTNTSSDTITKVDRISDSDSTSPDDLGYDNRYQTFNYGVSSGVNGPLISFGGLNNHYPMQITAAYAGGGNVAKFRTRNGDSDTWNSWFEFYHSGNSNGSSYDWNAKTFVAYDSMVANKATSASTFALRFALDVGVGFDMYGNLKFRENATSANSWNIYNSGGSTRLLTLLESGLLGVGEISPSEKLDVGGTIKTQKLKVYNDTGAGAIINFSDQDAATQNGSITYHHLDSSSYGSGNAFIFSGTESSMSHVFNVGTNSGGLQVRLNGVNYKVYHSGNDGTGSGLDADSIDGVGSTQFLRSDTPDTSNGKITFNAGIATSTFTDQATNIGQTLTALETFGSGSWGDVLGFSTMVRATSVGAPTLASSYGYWNVMGKRNTAGGYAGLLLPYDNFNDFYVGRNVTGSSAPVWAKIWTSESDGSGSGLDADKVDGLQASSFLRSDDNDTATGWITANGGLSVDTSKGFRLKRSSGANTGDDVVDFEVDDFGLNITVDNDNDGDGGRFVFQRKVGGAIRTMMSLNDQVLTLSDGTDNGEIRLRSDRNDVYIKENNYTIQYGSPSGHTFQLDSNTNGGGYFKIDNQGTNVLTVDGTAKLLKTSGGIRTESGNFELYAPASTGGWSRGLMMYNSAGSRYGIFGILGNASTGSYLYIGANYDDEAMRFNLAAEQINVKHKTYFNKDVVIDGGTSSNLTVLADDSGNATISAYGDSQGTGIVYVGQTISYGGGIEYNGDNSPGTSGAGSDKITLFRRDNGTNSWTARNSYNNNTWEFRGNVTAIDFINNSDRRLKKDIQDFKPRKIKTKLKTYRFKEDDSRTRVGVIAQDLQKERPEMVTENADGMLQVSYIDYLLERVEHQEDEITELKDRMERLELLIQELL